jgi:hypothetical protein
LTDLTFLGAAGLGGLGLSSLSGNRQSYASEPPAFESPPSRSALAA